MIPLIILTTGGEMREGVTEKNMFALVWENKSRRREPRKAYPSQRWKGPGRSFPVQSPLGKGRHREAQRGTAIIPRSHSKWLTELGFERRSDGNYPALVHCSLLH